MNISINASTIGDNGTNITIIASNNGNIGTNNANVDAANSTNISGINNGINICDIGIIRPNIEDAKNTINIAANISGNSSFRSDINSTNTTNNIEDGNIGGGDVDINATTKIYFNFSVLQYDLYYIKERNKGINIGGGINANISIEDANIGANLSMNNSKSI